MLPGKAWKKNVGVGSSNKPPPKYMPMYLTIRMYNYHIAQCQSPPDPQISSES